MREMQRVMLRKNIKN